MYILYFASWLGPPLALSILLAGAELCGGHNGGCTLYEFAFRLLWPPMISRDIWYIDHMADQQDISFTGKNGSSNAVVVQWSCLITIYRGSLTYTNGFHYHGFWLMYVQVGDFRASRGPTTVPLTRISCNTVFSNSQNARKGGDSLYRISMGLSCAKMSKGNQMVKTLGSINPSI